MKHIRRPSDQVYYWLMVIPALVFVFVFNTRTWPGILGAFQKFIPTKGWYGSKWIGLKNFSVFFMQPDWFNIIRNTLVISIGKIVIGQVIAIVFALMINEIRNPTLKRGIQTATYLPHFISWVVYASILKSLMGSDGILEKIVSQLIGQKVMLLGTPALFPILMIITETLKEFGWSAIIYLSALSNINPELYEAAEIDGANRWKQTLHVTLPGLKNIIVLNGALSLGHILSAGFNQIFNMYNTLVMSTADILDTWIYRQGIVGLNYGVSIAVGLLNGLVGMLLTIIAYRLAYKFADYKIF